ESDFLRSCVIGYGSSPYRCGPPALAGRRSNAGSPRFRRDPFARDVLFDPGRVDSTSHNGTAHVAFGSKGQPPPPAKRVFRGSITHPTQPLCTLRVRHCCRLTQHSLPGGLLGLTWAGLAPADRASFAGAFPLPPLQRRADSISPEHALTRNDTTRSAGLRRSGSEGDNLVVAVMPDVGAPQPWNPGPPAPVPSDLLLVHPEIRFVRGDGAATAQHDARHP